MKKSLFLAVASAVLFCGNGVAQEIKDGSQKLDAQAQINLRKYRSNSRATRSAVSVDTLRFIVTTTNAQQAADSIRALGGEVDVIDDKVLTMRITADKVERVAKLSVVSSIKAARRAKMYMDKTRKLTRVSNIESDTSFDTPYKGKGVVVGVIDMGFQYDHIAFKTKNKTSRVIAAWDLYNNNPQPFTTLPSGSDGDEEGAGHATHVTNIAAGSVVNGNSYYGIAPEADIVMVPNDLSDDNIMKGAKFIKQTAEAAGKPWVLNLSIGSSMGPHDSTTPYDVAMSNLCGSGGVMVAAMGNEAQDQQHVFLQFQKAGDVRYILNSPSDDQCSCYLWGTEADGKAHVKVTPMLFNTSTGIFREIPQSTLNTADFISYGTEIASHNNRFCYLVYADMPDLCRSVAGTSRTSNFCLALKVEALDNNVSAHAWSDSRFIASGGYGVAGDGEYSVGEAGASIGRAIAVGAYTGQKSWVSYEGYTYRLSDYTVNDIAGFSNHGPSLGVYVKPDVVAPGVAVRSALNAYAGVEESGNLKIDDAYVVGAVDADGNMLPASANYKGVRNFYGVMSGTSMATPVVTGVVALWLQANPMLTPEQIKEIISETSIRDTYTGGTDKKWTAYAGYGKIDAYAGLKKALQMGNTTGIGQTMTNEEPVSISKGSDAWRILFNTSEPYAELSLFDLKGKAVWSDHLEGVLQGYDISVPLAGYAPGVYLLRIKTQKAVKSFKVSVR